MRFSVYLIFPFVFLINLVNGNTKTFDSADWGSFGGATLNNGTFLKASGSYSWAGFENIDSSQLPITFPYGGELSFNASVPNGGSATVYFRFEKNPWPNTEPSYDTTSVTISGSADATYTIDIPSQSTRTFSSFLFYIEEYDQPVNLGTVVVIENAYSLPSEFYVPNNVTNYNSNFLFGQNSNNGESILWTQLVEGNPHNNEIQDYLEGQVGLDENDYLVLRIDRAGSNTYYSSRINTRLYDGIKVGSGEKLSVEFEAQLPMAKDSNGNYVPGVPLWPALWLMGNDKLNNNWVGWPFCAEIDVMEWSPTKWPDYNKQANVAYHWNAGDDPPYGHTYTDEFYFDGEIDTKFHKWRVDIYRYDDGINTNKIEIYKNDVLIPGSTYYEYSGSNNEEYWYPTTGKFPQTFGTNEKEYFLIMNIALGGVYPGTSNVPPQFEYAEMVVKSVNYEISSLQRFTLDLTYNANEVNVTKTPDQTDYQANSQVTVVATPNDGYVLGSNIWYSNSIIMDENKSFSISTYQDLNDDDSDGVTNYLEAIIYSSNPNSSDTDNDGYNDFFETIAGTSLIDSTDHFFMNGSMNSSGIYALEHNSVSGRIYSLLVSDDLNNWQELESNSGNGDSIFSEFNPLNSNINGLNTDNLYFKVNIEEEEEGSVVPPPPPPPPSP